MLLLATFTLAGSTGSSLAANSVAPDPCAALLPQTVLSQIGVVYPGFRLARVDDYAVDDVEAERQYRKGSPCLAVASADVNGDGRRDFAFLATSGTRTLLVVAVAQKQDMWGLGTLKDFGPGGPGGIYVDTIEAGDYTDLDASDQAPSEYVPEPGRVRHYRSRRQGFIAGLIESSGVAFLFTGTRWVHLWLSD